MKASLSIYGLYEYDDSIFDNLVLPSGMEDHRQELITEILLDCSDFTLLYPDWDFMKMLIGVWSKNELRIWEKMYQSEMVEYNPIENYDRHETMIRNVVSNSENSSVGSSAEAGTITNTGSTDRNEKAANQSSAISGSESTTAKTAYDSNTFKETGKVTGKETQAGNGSSAGESQEKTSTTGTTVNTASIKNDSAGSSSGAETVHNYVHGNIGVTTAAQMLEGFREISNFCTVKFICDSFKDRFCVQVY